MWLHLSGLTCCVYESCRNMLVFCSWIFKRQEGVATSSCHIYIEDGEHHVWWGSGTPLTHSLAETLQGGVMHSVELAENLRTWTRCPAEPPEVCGSYSILLLGPHTAVFYLCLSTCICPVSLLLVHPLKVTFVYCVYDNSVCTCAENMVFNHYEDETVSSV